MASGARPGQVAVLPPSVDRSRFDANAAHVEDGRPLRLGFVGRLEQAKGVFEIPPVLAGLAADGVSARAELAGPFTPANATNSPRRPCGWASRTVWRSGRARWQRHRPADTRVAVTSPALVYRGPSHRRRRGVCMPPAGCGGRGGTAGGARGAPGRRRAPRERYAELVARLLTADRRPPADTWGAQPRGRRSGMGCAARGAARMEHESVAAGFALRRARRLRPPRKVARAVLRRRD